MVYEQRVARDYVFGTLSAAVALADTTISSAKFNTLPTDYSTSRYLPLTLHDPALDVHETVWVTGHVVSSNNLTVVRGREGTTARPWPSGSTFVCAPSLRDGMGVSTRAALPSDAHVGQRQLLSDELAVAERTIDGWGPSVGVAWPYQVGPSVADGTTHPGPQAVVTLRSGYVSGTTDGSGNLSVVYKNPFPHGTVSVFVMSNSYNGVGPFVVYSATTTGFGFTTHHGSTARLLNTGIAVNYLALGW